MAFQDEQQSVQALLSIAESLDWLRRYAFAASEKLGITPPPLVVHHPVPLPRGRDNQS
jgi:hypothetical protein